MSKLSLAPRLYVGAVVASGAAVLAVAGAHVVGSWDQFGFNLPINAPHSWTGICIFLVLASLSEMATIVVPEEGGERTRQSLNAVMLLASVVVFPWYVATIVVALANLGVNLSQKVMDGRRLLYKLIFTSAETTLSVAGAATIFTGLGGHRFLLHPHLPGDGPSILIAILGAAALAYVMSYGLTIGAVSLVTGARIAELFAKGHRQTILPETTAAVMGVLFGYLWLANAPLSPIALLPLAVIYLAFSSFIRLQEVDRLKSNFISEVSHELRTPLSAILASSELLYRHGEGLSHANVLELARSSYESSNHLFRLVENLLNATTLQSGTLHVSPVSVSLDELVSEAITQVEPFVESKRQRISTTIPRDLPDVLADPRHIGQVLINLLTNASKYSPEDTTIGISCGLDEGWVRIAVTDQGMGIPEEEQRYIFERFYRAQNNRESSVVGSGLGLTIVKSLVELHRGRVGVTSYPGEGSIFWFTLPRVTSGAPVEGGFVT